MKEDQQLLNNGRPANFIRVPMEPLFERLLKKPFPDSVSAIEYCRSVCAEYGFTVKQEASANRNIYVYCSREGLPDSQRNPKPLPQRKRPSKRCDCRWRVVLSENENEQWEFRKSMNPNASEHNHEMMSPDEMVKAWPPEVNEMIIQLARQRRQTHEIRETVKHHFPNITWNERRFYNRLTEERKRIRQRGVVERSQRLLLLSARLCSIVASNEEWALSVETELQRTFENFCQMARLSNDNIHSLVDLQPGMIQIETDRLVSNTHGLSIDDEELGSPTKKRKSFSTQKSAPESQRGIQVVHVPSYTIQVRSSYSRCSVSSSSENPLHRVYNESALLENNQQQHQQQQQQQNNSLFAMASPTSSSSSTSSVPFQQRIQSRGVASPIHSPNEFMMSQPPYQPPQAQPAQQQQQQQHNSNEYSNTSGGMATAAYTTFSPYTMPTTAFTSSPELPFHFENPMIRPTSQQQQGSNFYNTQVKDEQQQQQQQYPLPMIRSNEDEAQWP